jgi:hypothetical protein
LPHLTSTPFPCHAPPHTPKGVVVWQLHCLTCHTLAEPQVWQVWQNPKLACGRPEFGPLPPARPARAPELRPRALAHIGRHYLDAFAT